MPQNIAEGIIQLGLVVTGLENLKSMTDHQRRFREETERLKPAEARTILTIEDFTQPILKAQIRSWEQLAAIITKVGLNAVAAIPQLEAMARAAGLRATSSNIGAQAAQFGLYPGDIAAVDEGQRLYGAARRGYAGLERGVRRPTTRLNRGGYIGYFGGNEIQKAVNYLARNGPAMGYPQLAALTSEDTVLDEAEAANLIATIAPQIQAANVISTMRIGLRAAMASGPFLGMTRRGFGRGTISPAAGQLAAIGPLGAFAEGNFGAKVTERLNRLALALAQMPKGFAFTGEPEPVRMSRLSRALLETSNFFGLPPGATAPYVRDEYTEQAEALEREAARRNIPARYIPRQVRPRYFGTGIEVTGRFVNAEVEDPLGERAAALARFQGEGLIPPFAIPGQRSGLMARARNYLGGWLPSWLPINLSESGFARGRGTGSITQDAIDFINQYKSPFRTPGGEPAIFPKTLGRVLNLPSENVQLLLASLQQQHYLGERSETGNYPIIPATIRQQRRFQAEQAAQVEKAQIAAMQEDTVQSRAKANAAKKAAAAVNQEAQSEEALVAANADALRRRKGFIFRGQTFLGPGAIPPGGVPVFAGQRFATEAPNFFGASEELGPTSINPGAWFGGGGRGFGGGGVTSMFGTPVGGGGGGGGIGRTGLFSFGRFASRFAGLTNFVAAAAIIYPIASLIFGAVGASVELEANVKRIQAIYGSHSLADQLTIKREIVQTAFELGENVNEVAKAAQAFAQEQMTFGEMGDNLKAAATGAKAFGLNLQQVSDYIIAINRTTGGKVGGLEAVNLIAAISRRAAVPPEAIMQTVQNVLPDLDVFAQPGGSVSNPALLASLTGIESRYGRVTGQQTGAALRFLISRLGNPKAVSNIEALAGVQLGTAASGGTELKAFDQILNEVSQSYERLVRTGQTGQAQQLMRELFGARQATAGTIILTHFKDALDLVTGSLNDQNAAEKMAADQLGTTKTAVENLRTSFTNLFSIVEVKAGPFINLIAKITEATANALQGGGAQGKTPGTTGTVFDRKWWLDHLGLQEGSALAVFLIGKGPGDIGALPSEIPNLNAFGRGVAPPIAGFNGRTIQGTPTTINTPSEIPNYGYSGLLNFIPKPDITDTGQLAGLANMFLGPAPSRVASTTNAKGKNLVMPGGFLEAFNLFERSITGSSTLLQQLGIDADNSRSKLERIKELLKRFYSPEEAAGKGPQGAILLQQFRETVGDINREDLNKNAITIERERRLQDLRFTTAVGRIARRGVEETPEATLQERVNDVLDTQRLKREEILSSYRSERELLIQQANDDKSRLPFLDAELEKADRKYELDLRGLSLEERQLIMEQQSTYLVEQKTRKLQEQRAVQNELNKITQQGLQGLIKGIEQERSTGGRVRLGQLLTSQLLGPLAGNITGKIGANFDLFGEKGLFPGVGRFIEGAFGRKQYPIAPPTIEDATREVQSERATQGVMSSGGGLSLAEASARRLSQDMIKYKAAKEAFDKKQARDQLIVSAGTFAGQLVGASEGGSEAAVNIGSSIGALAGTAIGGPIGGSIGGFLGGAIGGLFGHHRRSPEVGHLQIIAENTREQVRLLENTNKLLETNFVSFNVPTGFRLPAYVPGSFGGIGGLRGASGGVVNSQIAVNVNIGGTNMAADKLGQTIAQAISDRLELESRSSGGYFPRMLYG